MKTLLLASLLICGAAFAASPSSINNDDSCDIKVGPAATLLLPYFEVDTDGTSGQTTLFTITNVSRYPQIARVTLWTDWTYPVLTFNLFLTGYDVQSINLADVLIRGIVAGPNGTSQATTAGSLSASANPNTQTPLDCASTPGSIPETIMVKVRNALEFGVVGLLPGPTDSLCNTAGSFHRNAIGYATIDVVANCTARMPLEPLYFTTDLLFDNVLIGDYQQIGAIPDGITPRSVFDASGNPMVHIRAVPEGGGAGSNAATTLPYTFYDRYTPAALRTFDRRQPLPSTFAARFIEGGPSGFATNLTIWREGTTGAGADCASYYKNNSVLPLAEVIRFDEHENASSSFSPFVRLLCHFTEPPCPAGLTLLPTSSISSARLSPQITGPDAAGWFYINLNNLGSAAYSVTHDIGGGLGPTNARTNLSPPGATITTGPRPSQAWMTVTMFGPVGANRMTAELDATPLGNGCSPAAFVVGSNAATVTVPRTAPIAPAGGAFVCPPGTTLTNGTTALCTGTNSNPNP